MATKSLSRAWAKARQYDKERDQIEKMMYRLERLRDKNRRTHNEIFDALPEEYMVRTGTGEENPTEITGPYL